MIEITQPAERLSVIRVDTSPLTTSPDRDGALDAGVLELVRTLTAHAHDAQERVAVDVRFDGDDPLGAKEALLDAIRGLVQGYTAECGTRTPPVNVVASHAHQEDDRAATWRFLSDPDGALARGATFDLRTERP